MFIQGVPARARDFDRLRKQLPTGFSQRNVKISSVDYSDPKEGQQAYHRAWKFHGQWQETQKKEDMDLTLQSFEEASRHYVRVGNLAAWAQNFSDWGFMCLKAGDPQQAVKILQKAIISHEREECWDRLSRDYGNLYTAYSSLIQAETCAGHTIAAAQLRAKLKPLGEKILASYARERNEPIQKHAYRVEQGEVGFSATHPIGTDNVCDCVCVIVRDPVTRKTALAHIDARTDIQTLQLMFDRLPDRKPPEAPLQVRLLGAHHPDFILASTSRENTQKIITFLENKHVDIISAALLDMDQPRAVVVYPESFAIKEEIPGMHHANEELANGWNMTSYGPKPLRTAFDLTVSKQRAPVLFNALAIARVWETVLGYHEEEIYENLREGFKETPGVYKEHQIVLCAHILNLLGREYESTLQGMLDVLDETIASLAARGVKVTSSDREICAELIQKAPMHLGEGKEKANQPIIDAIEHGLFDVNGKRGYKLNAAQLENFSFTAEPYETVERGTLGAYFQAKITEFREGMLAVR